MAVKSRLRENRLQLVAREKKLEMEERQQQMNTQAEWLRIQKEEYELEQKWQAQQDEYDEFLRNKSVDGWVASTVQAVKPKKTEHKPNQPEKPVAHESRVREACREMEELKKCKDKNPPESGMRHLARMGLLPDYGVMGDKEMAPSVSELPVQKTGKRYPAEMWDHLSLKDEGKDRYAGDWSVPVDDARGEKDGKQKVKSGKYAKSHMELKKEESWPHLNVLRQYAKRTTFEQLDFESFVAGETRVISAMWGQG